MSLFRRHEHAVPELNTSSLPDLIFSVLFFFMIVTHMRTDLLKVRYQVPQGHKLEKLTHKSTVTHIYIGERLGDKQGGAAKTLIQVNDKMVTLSELSAYLQDEHAHAGQADQKNLSANICADRSTPMGVITDVKQALRSAGILKVSYTGVNLDQ